MKTIAYLNDKGKLSTTCKHRISRDDLMRGYLTMVMARYMDERMITLQRQGTISFSLSALGEEGCIVASAAALSVEDWLYPQYREGATMLWRGESIQQYVHHMFCNAEDPLQGRQMPCHHGSRALNIVTVSSPIGTKIPHAAGSAYGMKLKGASTVAMAYFGEGATSEGDFHVALNFAAVRKAPCIFFCRNNQYAISTPSTMQFASDGVAPKGAAYGIEAFRVDGNDYFAVHETVTKAKRHCLKGEGPVLIEAMTYRRGAHSTSDDPSGYRSKEEEDKWKEKCPIKRLRLYLESKGWWNQEQEEEFLQKLKIEVDEAIVVAKETPKPPMRSLIEDVYLEVPRHLEEQLEEVKRVIQMEEEPCLS